MLYMVYVDAHLFAYIFFFLSLYNYLEIGPTEWLKKGEWMNIFVITQFSPKEVQAKQKIGRSAVNHVHTYFEYAKRWNKQQQQTK